MSFHTQGKTMKKTEAPIPDALRDVFAKLTGKPRSEMATLQQLNEENIRVATISGWAGNVHRYGFFV